MDRSKMFKTCWLTLLMGLSTTGLATANDFSDLSIVRGQSCNVPEPGCTVPSEPVCAAPADPACAAPSSCTTGCDNIGCGDCGCVGPLFDTTPDWLKDCRLKMWDHRVEHKRTHYFMRQHNKMTLYPACSPICSPTYGYHQTCWRRFPECNRCPPPTDVSRYPLTNYDGAPTLMAPEVNEPAPMPPANYQAPARTNGNAAAPMDGGNAAPANNGGVKQMDYSKPARARVSLIQRMGFSR